MIDDHNRCECMNVTPDLLTRVVPDSPKSCKMIVAVVVVKTYSKCNGMVQRDLENK